MDVGGDADEVDDALVLGQDVLVVVGALGVGHDGDLERRGVVADDAADGVLVTVLPRTVLGGGVDALRGLVAQLHVVDPGGDQRLVDRFDELVLPDVLVDEPAVADGAVQDLNLGAIRHPRALGFDVFPVFDHGFLLKM